jgi:hypothetical protein
MSDKTKLVQLNDPTIKAADLRWYAENVLGLTDISKHNSGPQLLAKIRAASPDLEQIEVPANLGEAIVNGKPESELLQVGAIAADGDAVEVTDHYRFDPRVELQIATTSDKTKSKDVFVGVNGVMWVLHRGARMEVPYRVYEALNNGVESTLEQTGVDPMTSRPIYESTESHSYPHSIFKMPSEDAVNEWRERVSAFEAKREANRVKKAA